MLFLILSLNLWAQNIVIQSDGVSDIEFEQYLLENPNKTPYSESFTEQSVKKDLSEKLFNTLKKAQYEFINGSLNNATIQFNKIYEMRHDTNWNKNERKTIHYSIFRLAQLSDMNHKKNNYIKEAITFDQKLDPDNTLFPPPIISLFHKVKNQQTLKIWPLPIQSNKFNRIAVNGKIITNKTSFLQSTKGTKRFSFISNKFEPVHIVTDIGNLSTHKLSLTPLSQGSCESPNFSTSIKKENFVSYFAKNCILPTNMMTTSQAHQIKDLIPQQNSIKKSILPDNTWAWIGLTVITAAVAWKLNENNQKSPHQAPAARPTKKHFSNNASTE